jgi:cell division protein FtsB
MQSEMDKLRKENEDLKQEIAGFKLALTVSVMITGYFVARWLIKTGVLQ